VAGHGIIVVVACRCWSSCLLTLPSSQSNQSQRGIPVAWQQILKYLC